MSKQAGSQGRGSSGRGGWRRWTPEDGADAVARWRASGLTAKEFAAQEGVSAQRLHRWSKQQVDTSSPPLSTPSPKPPQARGTAVPFVRVATPAASATSIGTLRVEHLGVSVVVREDLPVARLADVVHALRAGASRC